MNDSPVDLMASYARFASIYDSYTTETADIDYYRQAALACGGGVLEWACGTGRVTLPLARAGVEVTAVDLSPEMLAACESNLKHEPPAVRRRIRLVEGDMRTARLDDTFPLVIVPFSSFLHLLTQQDQLRCLRNCRRHLAPDGRLMLDAIAPPLHTFHRSALGGTTTSDYGVMEDDAGYYRVFEDEKIDVTTQVSRCAYRVWNCTPGGRRRSLRMRFTLDLRYTFPAEFRLLLQLAGLREPAVYGGFDRAPLSGTTLHLTVEGRR